MPDGKGKRIARRVDHLGNLGERLQDLVGFETLAHELLQNAEDARATRVVFDIRDDALIVENDEAFTDCGTADDHTVLECPHKAAGKSSCDWHNLTIIAGHQKRDREDAIGKFGVGFLSVYQLTDRPEVISGRHWALEEWQPEGDRIYQCPGGCGLCAEVVGTRFVLPYAKDANSPMRRALLAPVVTSGSLRDLPPGICEAAPRALMFLTTVREVVVRDHGEEAAVFRRTTSDEDGLTRITVAGPSGSREWILLSGDFDRAAENLRATYGTGKLEANRAARVRLAIPLDATCDGILYAGLPTETRTGLPFLIDASFYPSTDRRRVIFETKGADHRTEWNSAAIRGAMSLLTRWLPLLRTQLGPTGFWTFLLATAQATTWAKPGSSPVLGLRELGDEVARAVRDMESAYTHDGRWVRPDLVVVLQREAEAASIPAVTATGLSVLHPDLRTIVSQGLVSNDTGLGYLTLRRLLGALDRKLARPLVWSRAPEALATYEGLRLLWNEIRLLVEATGEPGREIRMWMARLSVAPTTDGDLLPPGQTYRGDDRTRALVEALGIGVALLDARFESESGPLLELCPTFDVAALVATASRLDAEALDRRWRAGAFDPDELLRWLAARMSEFRDDAVLVGKLRRLHVYAVGDRLSTLEDAVLPGDFPDPVGIARTIRAPGDPLVRALLRELGVHPLTISEFAVHQVPKAIAQDRSVDVRRAIVDVLADNVSLLEGDEAARNALAAAALVECIDGQFRAPRACVLDSEEARLVLGPGAPLAILRTDKERSHRHLLEWLGVSPRLTADQLRHRIDDIASSPPTADAVLAMERVARHLDARLHEDSIRMVVEEVKAKKWLPARDDVDDWWTPTEVYTVFVEHLFGTFGRVVAFSREAQASMARSLFSALEIGSSPPPALVVQHLLASAAADRRDLEQARAIYVYLGGARQIDDPALDDLRGRPSLLLKTGWVRPEDVYWEAHPFGERRHTLGYDFLLAKPCLDRIGVRQRPGIGDAIAVLREISSETPADDVVSPEDADGAHGAWGLIAERLADDAADETQSTLAGVAAERIALDREGRLAQPGRLYFEDRPALTDKFPVEVRSRIIPYDLAIGPALRAAGVRDLGAVLSVVKLEAGEERPASAVDELLASRWVALRRVLEANRPNDSQAPSASPGSFLRVESDQLVVQFELPDEPGRPATAPEKPDALFLPGDVTKDGEPTGVLYVRSGPLPLRAIARELAVALAGPRSVPAISPGFSAVLGAASADDAEEALDDLGLARVAADESSHVPGAVADDFGGVPAADETAVVDVEAELDQQGDDGAEAEDHTAAPAGADTPEVRTSREVRGTGGDHRAEPRTTTGAGRRQPRSGAKTYAAADPMLRTYLPSPTAEGWELTDEEKARRTATDEAGVKLVLDYELRAGRAPRSMPHNHPGYDVESTAPDGSIRYIEIKSISGPWQTSQAALSREQHRVAMELREKYWLYVVERAGLDTAELHPIQDPIGQANHFGFDPGWREVAFDAEAPYEELEAESETGEPPA